MAEPQLTLLLDSSDFDSYLRALEKNINDTLPVMRFVRNVISKSTEKRFRSAGEGGNKWKPLAPSTIAERQRRGTWTGGRAAGQPILNETSALMNAIVSITGVTHGSFQRTGPMQLEKGTTFVKAGTLQYGAPVRAGVASIPAHTREIGGNSVNVAAHTRAYAFGLIPPRPYLYFSSSDITKIMSITSAYAFSPDVAARLRSNPNAGL